MTPLERVLSKLEGVRRSGVGYVAYCPAHHDRHRSLSVGEGKEDRVLLKCFAGCTVEQIVRALSMQLRDLFPEGTRRFCHVRNGRRSTGSSRIHRGREGGDPPPGDDSNTRTV